MMHYQVRPIAVAIMLAFCQQPYATEQSATELSEVVVNSARDGGTAVPTASINFVKNTTDDVAVLLQEVPGVAAFSAGGVSSLPTVHGLADDRLRIQVDGMDLIASCPNHMNSPLSYVTPANLEVLKVYTGVAPVSLGGDSIGAAVIAETKTAEFASNGQSSLIKGELGASYRSNGNAMTANASATYATESFSLSYSGSTAEAENYKAGGDYKKFSMSGIAPAIGEKEVGSTAYKARNQMLTVALRGDTRLIEAKLSYQDIPYELYPNQRMDMLDNQQKRASVRWFEQMDNGFVEARAYHEDVDHFMDFGPDKLYSYGSLTDKQSNGGPYTVSGMPMYTTGKTDGASVKTEIRASDITTYRAGFDLQHYRLNDWWTPAPNCGYDVNGSPNCVGGMSPDNFVNINNGKRDRQGFFGEWESKWSSAWLSIFGVRVEQVTSDTGNVHGYNTSSTPGIGMMSAMYEGSSVGTRTAFNSMDRKRTDTNLDWSAIGRYTPDDQRSVEFGASQKTRSPNLYERYAWSTNGMAMEMINVFGDGNGYVGNPDLKPEIAHTISVTGDWHAANRSWEFKATPYYSRISDYIDVIRRPTSMSMAGSDYNATRTTGYVKLQYMNQAAELYGIDLSGRALLADTKYGEFSVRGIVNYTRGKNLDTGDGLYNIMPLNAKAILTQQAGGWNNAIELIGVSGKHDVSATRNEIKTSGYSLVNLRASYTMSNIRIDFGVENLFDRLYYLPLGGAYTGQGATMSFNNEVGNVAAGMMGTSGNVTTWGTVVPGMGRSIYAGVNYKF